MEFKYLLLVSVLTFIGNSCAAPGVWTLVHDLVQNNVAGVPVVHEHTEWDFDPEQGKQRRIQFEALNGRFGNDLIARLGMGNGFKGPWGVKVSGVPKPDLKYNA